MDSINGISYYLNNYDTDDNFSFRKAAHWCIVRIQSNCCSTPDLYSI